MQSQTTPHKLRQSTLSYAAGLTTAVVGLLVLVGWTLDIATLKSLLPNAVTMKTNTAACFVLAGLALVLLQRSGPITGALARFCALVIALVGLFTLSEYFLGWDLGIDQMVFHESGVSLTPSYPGRMAPNTALNFVLIGFAFWLLSLSRLRSNLLLEFPLIFALSISILGLVGYLTGLVELAGPAAYTQMAVHTASVFILLCTGMLFTAYRQERAPITIEQKLFAGLTATAAVIIFISFLSVSGITTLVQASGWVEHTQQAKNQIESVLAHVLEVQSGERGFLLAGDDKYLLALKEASRGLPALMNNLRLTASDNPRQQELFASLETLVEARVAFSDQMVSTRRTEGDEEARLLFATGTGKRITDSIRVLIAQMIAEEDRLLQTRNEDETHQANRTQLIIYLSLSVQVMLLMFIFVVVNRDVTGRTKTEEVLRQKTEELDQYFTHTLDLLCIADMNGYFRRLNNAWESTLGYSLQDLEGKPFLDFVHPDDIKATLEAMSDLGAGKEVLSFTNRYRCKDGSYRWIEWRSFPAGNLIYAAARDITERKRADEEVRQSNTELEAANKELEAFSYSVSHDLRAPLRAIDGFSQALLEDYPDKLDDRGRSYLQRVRGATQRMAQLIDDMLNLSRVTRAEMHIRPVNLTEIANEIAEELQKEQPERDVEFRISTTVTSLGDKRLLRIVLENLLGNAWKFTSKHAKAKVEFGGTEVNGKQAFFVRDDGAGFDMAFSDKLFGAFQRLHSADEFAGTGIGLATVQRIVHRHGGRVWAEGKTEAGATFYFTL